MGQYRYHSGVYDAYVIPAGRGTYSFTDKYGIFIDVIRNPGQCSNWDVTTGRKRGQWTPVIMDMEWCREHA